MHWLNRLARAFIEYMDCVAWEDGVKTGFSEGLSLSDAQRLRRSTLKQLVAIREDVETFDNQYYAAVVQNALVLAPEHPDSRMAILALFLEYCQFQLGLKLLSNEPTVRDELEGHGLEALAKLRPDQKTLRPFGQEIVSVFEGYVASGLSCLGLEYGVLAEIVDCVSILYDMELPVEVARVVKYHCGDEDSDPPSPTRILQ